MDHKWKNWLLAFWATVFLCLGSVFFFQVTVDPMGVWSAASTAGFNNFKTSQEQTERIFKIYQYRGYEPEVVFLGSSRVNYCMPPQWPGIPDDKVYNMGITAAHIPEESFYFDAMLDTHLPKIVAVGIDLLQFSSRYNKPHKGFSEDRLWMVSFSPFTSFVEKAKETVLSFDAVRSSIDVMEASEENPDATYYERGWDTQRLKKWPTGRGKFRHILYRYHTNTYRKFSRSNKNYRLFNKMIRRAEKRGVKIVMYTHPVHADFLMAYDINGLWEEFEFMKREIVKLGPLWDFNYINDVSKNRDNYNDPSHFEIDIGRRIARILGSGKTEPGTDFGVFLNKDNIDETLNSQRQLMDSWIARNREMYNLLEDTKNRRNKNVFQRQAVRLIGR